MEDKYRSYTVPELAGDDTFIRWILLGENHQRWEIWRADHPETNATILRASQIIRSMNALPVSRLSDFGKQELWNRIESSTRQPSRNVRIIAMAKWALAAAAALALMIWVNSQRLIEKQVVAMGERKEITLPESSEVFINADSKLRYHKEKFISDRELTLHGEAFFEVEHGSSFTVHTSNGDVTVIGTSFNVLSRPGVFEVSCFSGKVKVSSDQKPEVILTRGEKIVAGPSGWMPSSFVPSALPSWTEGVFKFDDQRLEIVIKELERQYEVKVVLPEDLKELRYTGLFETGDLSKALYDITWPLHLHYEIQEDAVIISR